MIGGELEIATSSHVRIAERNVYYALPEAVRGIYVGGGASVRVARIIGKDRMIEMMLTGRTHDAVTGHGFGISHYLVDNGTGEVHGLDLARRVAGNAPLSNYAILNAIPRISDMSANDGFFVESLMAAVVQTGDAAQQGLTAKYEGGDHLIIVGYVLSLTAQPHTDGRPLVFFGGKYRQHQPAQGIAPQGRSRGACRPEGVQQS